MEKIEIHFGEVENAISVMREVAAWGRKQGYRVWPDEWLTQLSPIVTPGQTVTEAPNQQSLPICTGLA